VVLGVKCSCIITLGLIIKVIDCSYEIFCEELEDLNVEISKCLCSLFVTQM
jgi:hypothetical protein